MHAFDVERLFGRFYPLQPGGQRFRNGTAPFYDWLLGSLHPSARVLNVGAGSISLATCRRVRESVGRLAGVDIDVTVLTNPDLDEARITDGVLIPYEDNAFDAVYSDWTMEHVEHPETLLREIHRVLKPGCSYWLRTTNLCHYVTLTAAATPHSFHVWLLQAIGAKPQGHDPWPTYYRANTRTRIRRLLKKAGFDRCELLLVETYPTYLGFSRVAFLLGVLYERVVNSMGWLSGFRIILMARATKSSEQDGFGRTQ